MTEEAKPPVPLVEQPAPGELQWSGEDLLWLEQVPAVLQPIARRHGRLIFSFVMQSGTSNHALGIMQRRVRGNNELMKAMMIFTQVFENIFTVAVEKSGLTLKQFQACKDDVELIAAIATAPAAPGERRSPSGIILNS